MKVGIDALTPIVFKRGEVLDMVPFLIEDTLKFEETLEKGEHINYSYEDIFERHKTRNFGGLDEMSVKTLLTRGIRESKPGSGMFHFTHDIRVKYLPVMTFSSRQVSHIAKNFR